MANFLKFVFPDQCWEWQGKINKKTGYGHWKKNYKDLLAHRQSYIFFKGSIQKNMTIDHICKNRRCVNPWHLQQITQTENILRGESPSAHNARKTHCKNGHIFSLENTRIQKQKNRAPTRICKICESVRQKKYRSNHIMLSRSFL